MCMKMRCFENFLKCFKKQKINRKHILEFIFRLNGNEHLTYFFSSSVFISKSNIISLIIYISIFMFI